MKWLVAVACMKKKCLNNPEEFLLNPSSRIQPTWVCHVVTASDKNEAFIRGEDAFYEKLFADQQPDDELMNWYVARLPRTFRGK